VMSVGGKSQTTRSRKAGKNADTNCVIAFPARHILIYEKSHRMVQSPAPDAHIEYEVKHARERQTKLYTIIVGDTLPTSPSLHNKTRGRLEVIGRCLHIAVPIASV